MYNDFYMTASIVLFALLDNAIWLFSASGVKYRHTGHRIKVLSQRSIVLSPYAEAKHLVHTCGLSMLNTLSLKTIGITNIKNDVSVFRLKKVPKIPWAIKTSENDSQNTFTRLGNTCEKSVSVSF